MNAHHTLALPELLEVIFAFLSRKDLYRSCTRVNSQWNSMSMHIIQEKRKAEFIKIPSIRENIFFHLYRSRCNLVEFINYCYVSKTWSNILNHLRTREYIFISLYHYDCFLDYDRIIRRKLFSHNKKRLMFFMNSQPHCLKYDCKISRYYQDIEPTNSCICIISHLCTIILHNGCIAFFGQFFDFCIFHVILPFKE